MICCCNWGAASAAKDSGEWPEFECKDCPVHCEGLGPVEDRCRRHRKAYDAAGLEESRAQRDRILNDRSQDVIDDLVQLEKELST